MLSLKKDEKETDYKKRGKKVSMASKINSVLTYAINKFDFFTRGTKPLDCMRYTSAKEKFYEELPEKVIFQEKYDGMFVRMGVDGEMYSLTGNYIGAGQTIGWANPTGFDCLGEIIGAETRQKTIGLVARLRSGCITDVETDMLKIKWFDCLSGETYEKRLERLWDKFGIKPDHVLISKNEAYERAVKIIENGGEGGMVANPNALYEVGIRSKNHLKLKRAYEADLVVSGTKKGVRHGSFCVESSDVKNPIRVFVKYNAGVFLVSLGDIVTIRFMESTGSSLTHPRLIAIRDDKTIADSRKEIKGSKPFISFDYKKREKQK